MFGLPVASEAFVSLTIISGVVSVIALGLLIHLCLFHIYINAIGITTYEYVRAHRVALERSARELSEPTTSTTGAAAPNAVQTAVNGQVDDGWNVDDGSVRSECPQKCRRLCVRVQIEPVPQQQLQTQGANGHHLAAAQQLSNQTYKTELSPIRNGGRSYLERTEQQEARYKARPAPVPMPSVSTVPRLPLILSVDGVARNYDEEPPPVKDIKSKHSDRATHHGASDFENQIFVIDGD